MNLLGWTVSHPARFWKKVSAYAESIDAAILRPDPSDDNYRTLLLHNEAEGLSQLLDLIHELKFKAVDPTNLPMATEVVPTYFYTPFRGRVIPNYHVLSVKDWSVYYRLDHNSKTCKGVEIIYEAHKKENLGAALELLWEELSNDIWG